MANRNELKPFRVKLGCGCIVIRNMREATARVCWTPELVIDNHSDVICDGCRPAYDAKIKAEGQALVRMIQAIPRAR